MAAHDSSCSPAPGPGEGGGRDEIAEALAGAEVFSSLAPGERAAIASFATLRRVGTRQVIFGQGDPCSHLYVVLDGAVKLVVGNVDRGGKVLDFVGPGGVFGEEAVFADDGHQTSAMTLSRSAIVAISAAPFARIAQETPRAAWAMLNGLSRRVATLAGHMERLASLSAEQRLAAFLLRGRGRPGAARPPLQPSRRDIASHLAVTPETLSRTVAAFRSRGWIGAGRRGFEIIDREAIAGLLGD